jgi:hypothetical protein
LTTQSTSTYPTAGLTPIFKNCFMLFKKLSTVNSYGTSEGKPTHTHYGHNFYTQACGMYAYHCAIKGSNSIPAVSTTLH